MSDDKLRAIYNARVTASAPADRTNCPTPEQLQLLTESGKGGSASNIALLDHVFGCAYCRPEFALLRAVQFESEDADTSQRARTKARNRWLTGPRLALAAGVLVAIAIGGESLRRMSGDAPQDVLRSAPGDASDVVLVAPARDAVLSVDAPFVWRKVTGAVTYEVQLLDTTGVVIATHVTSDTVFSPAADDRAKLASAKVFDWYVSARRADGNERRSSIARARAVATERR